MEKNLSKAKMFYFEKISKPLPLFAEQNELINQIRDTSQRLAAAYSRFEIESNEDLLDSIIYEIQSLKALYRYLIKRAKTEGLQCGEISVFGREVI